MSKTTRGENIEYPLLDFIYSAIKTGRYDTTLVDTSNKVNNDFARTVIINKFKISNITVLLHHLQEFDHDFRGRANENLSSAFLFAALAAASSSD